MKVHVLTENQLNRLVKKRMRLKAENLRVEDPSRITCPICHQDVAVGQTVVTNHGRTQVRHLSCLQASYYDIPDDRLDIVF